MHFTHLFEMIVNVGLELRKDISTQLLFFKKTLFFGADRSGYLQGNSTSWSPMHSFLSPQGLALGCSQPLGSKLCRQRQAAHARV